MEASDGGGPWAAASRLRPLSGKLLPAASLLMLLMGQLLGTSLAAMNLPDGIENILGFVPKSSFQCERDGYFGDIDNDCRLFHLCQRQVHSGGRVEWRHWTYACGNQTMFNQLTLTCAFVDEAIPCRHASQFQYLNEVIHKPREPFLTDADVTSGISYYSNRIMSDGARARAYEDAQLMAQLGGGGGGGGGGGSAAASQPALTAVDELSPRSAQGEGHFAPERELETFRELASNQPQPQFLHQPQPQLLFNPRPPVVEPLVTTSHQQTAFSSGQQQQAPVQPQSFDFSIATNHQVGGGQGQSQSQVLVSNQGSFAPFVPLTSDRQQQQAALLQPVAAAAASLPPAPTTTTTPAAATTTTAGSRFTSPVATTASALPTAFTLRPITTTTTTARPPPTTTTTGFRQAPAFTTTTQTPVATSGGHQRPASLQTTRKRQTAAASSSARTNQQLSRHQSADFSHSPGFQSTRIVRNSQQQPTSRQDSALVMRPSRHHHLASSQAPPTTTTTTTTRRPSLSLAGDGSLASSSSAFWRRPFDGHFLAPRFESLLTRRRV